MTEPTDADIKRAIATVKRKRYASLKAERERAATPAGVNAKSERDRVTAEAVRLLQAHPAVLLAWKQTVGHPGKSKYQVAPPGLGDICFVMKHGARFGSLEAKIAGSKAALSQAQMDMMHTLATSNAITGIITRPEQAVEIVEAATRMVA